MLPNELLTFIKQLSNQLYLDNKNIKCSLNPADYSYSIMGQGFNVTLRSSFNELIGYSEFIIHYTDTQNIQHIFSISEEYTAYDHVKYLYDQAAAKSLTFPSF